MQRAVRSAAAIAIVALASCDQAGDRTSDWGYVHTAILRPSCATSGCHAALSALGGVDLSTPDRAYTQLTGRSCGEPPTSDQPTSDFVRPGHPETSQLVYMLRGDGTDLVMPPDLPLPEVEIAIVERWILEGATCE